MSYSNYNRNYSRHRSGKIKWKKIILTVLGVVLALALISGIVSFFKDDTKTVHPVWALGDARYEIYSLNDQMIYTKEMFPCKGLAIELDYGFECMYTVSYYDKDGEYLGRDLYMDQEEVSAVADVPENAFFARITLEPALLGEVNSNGNSIPGKIEWHEIATYGSKLKITVDREQPDIDRAEEHFLPLSERKIDLHNVNSNEGVQFGMVTYTSSVNKMLENKTITQIGFPILSCDVTSFEFDAAKGTYVPIAFSNDKLKKFRDDIRYKEEVEWYERALVGRQRQRDKLLLKSYKKAHTRKQRIDSGFEDGYRADQLRIAKKWYNNTLGEIYKE